MLFFGRSLLEEMPPEVSHVTTKKRTGILVKQKYLRFLKNTIQAEVLSKLNVEITGSDTQQDGRREIILVGKGESPFKFKEAKTLIRSTVNMTEKNWKEIQKGSVPGLKSDEAPIVDIEDDSFYENISSEDDKLDASKENLKESPGTQIVSYYENISSEDDKLNASKENLKESPGTHIVCEGKSTEGFCTVVVDTHGGPSSIDKDLSGALYRRKSKKKVVNNIESSTSESNLVPSNKPVSQKKATSNNTKQDSEDLIRINSTTKKKDPGNETIVLGEETILITSGEESEEDIKIEKIVERKSSSPASDEKRKKKTKKSPLSTPVPPKCTKLKRKEKDSPHPWERKPKISKKSLLSDVTSSFTGVDHVSNHNSSNDKLSINLKDSAVCTTSGASTSRSHAFDKNLINPDNNDAKKTGLRPIVIDANNVGRHRRVFLFRRLEICIKYFRDRNHHVVALLPRHMQAFIQGEERARMWQLEEQQILCFTPSRKMSNGKHYAAYDDRFVVQTATELNGIIVSNDNFRDILPENERWKETIENRLLMYTWVGDMLMFPNDPLGRDGPHLEEFLRFPKEKE